MNMKEQKLIEARVEAYHRKLVEAHCEYDETYRKLYEIDCERDEAYHEWTKASREWANEGYNA